MDAPDTEMAPARQHGHRVRGLNKSLAFGLSLLLLIPGAVAGYQLMQVADTKGCPSNLLPSEGPLRLRLFYQEPAQLAGLKVGSLTAYLSDRMGRQVQVAALEQADETGFRLAAASRPFSNEVLVFLAFRTSFPDVPTSQGLVDALGFATPGTACAYVSFLPTAPVLCRVGAGLHPVQPAYAYVAHETGHLLGLSHSPQGIMGKGVFRICHGDTFTATERAQIQGWGYS